MSQHCISLVAHNRRAFVQVLRLLAYLVELTRVKQIAGDTEQQGEDGGLEALLRMPLPKSRSRVRASL